MDSQNFSRVTYDIPQEQLNYFDSRARSSERTAPSTNVRAADENRELPHFREAPQRAPQQVSQRHYDDDDDDEPKLISKGGSLSDQYQQFFGGAQPRDAGATRSNNTAGAQAGHRFQRPISEGNSSDASSYTQKAAERLIVRETARPQVRPARPTYPAAVNPHSNEFGGGNDTATRDTESDDVHRGHNSPSATTQRSVTNEPRGTTIPSSTAARGNRRRGFEEDLLLTSHSDYEQRRGDRQEKQRKSSFLSGTPMSRDSRSQRSESIASVDDSEAMHRLPRDYNPRPGEATSPMLHPAALSQPQQHVRNQSRVSKKEADEEEKIRDEEENCTFHPQINKSSTRRSNNVHESPYRGSEGTNPPRDSPGDCEEAPYDKLYNNAENIRRTAESRRTQKRVDEMAAEMNEKYGPRSTAVNPRRSAAEQNTSSEKVFVRLYADAQRYNREKTEQERLLELKRQEERSEAPFDWNKGKERKEDTKEEVAVGGEAASASRPRSSPSRQKPLKNRAFFERLARPTSVTVSFLKQKEIEEQEKQEKVQHALEQKTSEMEEIASYDWGIPTKSFTFADLKSQNAMYVS
ncbi:hypothetical protein ABB37_00861 [Leptomonas pyrrhocoris]|uniref:Uncharacterized protein n=1 Tax=Leptomonas pyrrhocoris TaxID=157538 RepID=A0A0N0VI82_LEPPY|nr:hypothetical protein ABB37_00861 [Leptomonas pyrrhocoris]XP_015665237.1 hypothetical protein ABB37_00861 [Leptomonas pyrrhocoris]KPA86797.1 hypothetical protein ABB37_00861 [Leptomonas pyrrhocoris]KPA86798.1 hypothetical protein ABB37_00861 [Leptomonas pyrrhocoris]|eukprot:XP_015665236.1 hypothetical protein ABB37_00861 [Leptomonas pyrrhocoris]